MVMMSLRRMTFVLLEEPDLEMELSKHRKLRRRLSMNSEPSPLHRLDPVLVHQPGPWTDPVQDPKTRSTDRPGSGS